MLESEWYVQEDREVTEEEVLMARKEAEVFKTSSLKALLKQKTKRTIKEKNRPRFRYGNAPLCADS